MPRKVHLLEVDDSRTQGYRVTYCGLKDMSIGDWSYALRSADCLNCIRVYQEKKTMSSTDDNLPNNRTKLYDLDMLHSEAVIAAIEDRVPQPYMRNRIFATILAKERRIGCEPTTADDVTKWSGYYGRTVEIPTHSVTGTLSSTTMINPDLTVLVVDGVAYPCAPHDQVWVFPEDVEVHVPEEGKAERESLIAAARRRRDEINARRDREAELYLGSVFPGIWLKVRPDNLEANKKTYVGMTVRSTPNGAVEGVLSDAGKRGPALTTLVIDGLIYTFNNNAELLVRQN